MSSIRRIVSSRANGALSRGPITPEGKRTSSANSLRHGLVAETVVLANESRVSFEALLEAYVRKFCPRDEVEADLVEEMVVAKWRQRRLWSIETAAIDLETDRQAKTVDREIAATDAPTRTAIAFTALEDKSKAISLFLRYESRMRRGYRRALVDFHALCGSNLPNEPSSGPAE